MTYEESEAKLRLSAPFHVAKYSIKQNVQPTRDIVARSWKYSLGRESTQLPKYKSENDHLRIRSSIGFLHDDLGWERNSQSTTFQKFQADT